MGQTKTPDAAALVDHNAAQAIVNGTCADPFAQLGLQNRDGAVLLSVFVPGADSVTCLAGKTEVPLVALPDYPGLFVAAFPKAPQTYRLHATAQGHNWTFDDPYRFGPVLSQDDLYFVGEGSYRRLW